MSETSEMSETVGFGGGFFTGIAAAAFVLFLIWGIFLDGPQQGTLRACAQKADVFKCEFIAVPIEPKATPND